MASLRLVFKRVLFVLIGLAPFSVQASELGQSCTDPLFIATFAESEACLLSNEIAGCAAFYSSLGAIAGSSVGGLTASVTASRPSSQRAQAKAFEPALKVSDETIERFFKTAPLSEKTRLMLTTNELNSETVQTLRNRGFRTEQIEKVRGALLEYRQSLARAEALEIYDIDDLEDALRRNEARQKALQLKQKKNQGDAKTKTELDGLKKSQTELTRALQDARSQHRLMQVERRSKFLKALSNENAEILKAAYKTERAQLNRAIQRGAVTGAVGFAAVGAAIELVPLAANKVAIKKCRSQIGFRDQSDERVFVEYAAVAMRDCRSEVDPRKVWDLLLLEPEKRNKLMLESPSLCRAFENSFVRRAKSLAERRAEVNLSATQCRGSNITTEVKVQGRVYQQTLHIEDHLLRLQGSFLSGVDIGDLKENEKFMFQLNPDMNWSGVNTANPVWGSIPAVRENFLSVASASRPDLIRDAGGCETLDGKNEIDRRMVNTTESSRKLMCAVHDQAMAAKQIVPLLIEYCQKMKSPSATRPETKSNSHVK